MERYADYKEVSARIKSLRESKERQESEMDYIRFQLAQLKELNLIPGEDAELEAEERKLSNVNEIKSNLWQCEELMSGDGGSSMLSSLSVLSHNMSRLCEFTTEWKILQNVLKQCYRSKRCCAHDIGIAK